MKTRTLIAIALTFLSLPGAARGKGKPCHQPPSARTQSRTKSGLQSKRPHQCGRKGAVRRDTTPATSVVTEGSDPRTPVGPADGLSPLPPSVAAQTEASWTGFHGGKATITATGAGSFEWTILDECRAIYPNAPTGLPQFGMDVWDWAFTYHQVQGEEVLLASPPVPAPDCEGAHVLWSAQSTTGSLGLRTKFHRWEEGPMTEEEAAELKELCTHTAKKECHKPPEDQERKELATYCASTEPTPTQCWPTWTPTMAGPFKTEPGELNGNVILDVNGEAFVDLIA